MFVENSGNLCEKTQSTKKITSAIYLGIAYKGALYCHYPRDSNILILLQR